MSLLKPLIDFLFRFLLIYALLLVPWTGIAESYTQLFRTVGESLFGTFGSKGIVRFLPLTDTKPVGVGINDRVDTEILYTHRDLIMEEKRRSNTKMTFGASMYSIWYSSYLPTVLVIALIIATPIRGSRKGWALFWGLILVHGFIIFCLFIHLLAGFNQSKAVGLVVLSPFWENILLSMHKVLINDIGSKYIVAIFIWLTVVMRRNEWMTLAEKFNLYPADNRLEGKETLHSLIKPPRWVVARKLSDGTVQLKWAPVKEATGYQVYRQKPNQNQLKPYKSLSRAVTVTKCKTAKAQFCRYAVASIGLVNDQKIVSVLSDKVTAKRGN